MQDTTSLYENSSQLSPISDINYEIQSKSITAKTKQQQKRIVSRFPPIQHEPAISPKATRRNRKPGGYEPPASDRESWWRATIKNTPNPGTYDTHLNTFIKEMGTRSMTYGFKSDGRRRDPQPLEPKGKELLPGAYAVEDFVERMNRLRFTYGFKGPERDELLRKSMLNNQDKDINVAPGSYETQKYQTIDVPVEPARHSFFKSKTTRRPFLPKIGPAPSDYEPNTKLINTSTPAIISSFRSRTDRFHTKLLNFPGPGTYDTLTTFPKLKQIDMFSDRGLFFNANFSQMAPTAV